MISKIFTQCAFVLALFFYSPIAVAAQKQGNKIGLGFEAGPSEKSFYLIQGVGGYGVISSGTSLGFFLSTNDYGTLPKQRLGGYKLVLGQRLTKIPFLFDVSVGDFGILEPDTSQQVDGSKAHRSPGVMFRFGYYDITDSNNIFTVYGPGIHLEFVEKETGKYWKNKKKFPKIHNRFMWPLLAFGWEW
jgi:hypothetical protein